MQRVWYTVQLVYFSDNRPNKLSQMAMEKGMINRFCAIAQHTFYAPLPLFFHKISSNLQLIVSYLPEKKFDFQRHLASPNISCYSASHTSAC